MSDEANTDITALTVPAPECLSFKNTVASTDLADLIATTRSALGSAASDEVPAEEATYEPAVSVRKALVHAITSSA
jgi:predicted transcriptional regulator